jgi:hypothetical protein
MQKHLGAALVALVLLVVGCGDSGPSAPDLGASQRQCGANFCIEFPDSWTIVEASADFVSLAHPDAPSEVLATVGQVNMEGIVAAAGQAWPQSTDMVIRAFWSLIDGGGAELSILDPLRDGSIQSFGTFAGGRLWYRLTPLDGTDAIGVEVRAPNSSWANHAEAIMGSLAVRDA